jgi:hypothetical protein
VAPAAPGPNSHTVVNFGVAVRGTHSFDTDLSPVVITPTGYEVHAWVSSSHTLNGIGTFSAGRTGSTRLGSSTCNPWRMYVVFDQGTFVFGTCHGKASPWHLQLASVTVTGLDAVAVPRPTSERAWPVLRRACLPGAAPQPCAVVWSFTALIRPPSGGLYVCVRRFQLWGELPLDARRNLISTTS